MQETPMDFDVTGTNPKLPAAKAADATSSVNMDEMVFDVTTTHTGAAAMGAASSAAAKAPAESVLGDLIFDITANHPGMPATAAPAAPTPAADEGLAFTLDFPTDFTAGSAQKSEKPVDIGLGDISLNLDSLAPAAASLSGEAKDEHWQEVATKLDLAKAYQEMGDCCGCQGDSGRGAARRR